jgi:hypothetical protein
MLALGLRFYCQIAVLMTMLVPVCRAPRTADRLVWPRDYRAVSGAARVGRRAVGADLLALPAE